MKTIKYSHLSKILILITLPTSQIVEVSSDTMLRIETAFSPQIREGSHRYALKTQAKAATGTEGVDPSSTL